MQHSPASYADLDSAIKAIAVAHVGTSKEDYFIDALCAIRAAHKVTRLDLYHLCDALAEGHAYHAPQSPAESVIMVTYNRMDEAAAFGLDVRDLNGYPLVIPDPRVRDLDFLDYSVTEDDGSSAADSKRERQHPSIIGLREYTLDHTEA